MLNVAVYRNGSPEEVFSMIDSLSASLFLPLAQLAHERYGIPEEIFVRHCRRILIASRAKYFRITRAFGWLAPLYFRLYYFLWKISLRILPKHRSAFLQSDVTFELWCPDGSPNYRFYENIHALIRDTLSVAFFVNNIPRRALKKTFAPHAIFSDVRIDQKIARDVLAKEHGRLPHNGSGIDSYFLWGAFLRQYCIYATHCRHLKTKTFVTAGDNYLTPLRYWLMKHAGITTIIALQNGFRTDCLDSGGAYYIDTDLYEVFSPWQQALLQKQGCRAQQWLPMGSITALKKLDSLIINHQGPIVVIGHDFSYTVGSYNKHDFLRWLEHVRRFALQHKIRVQYKARTGSAEERRNYDTHLASDWTYFDDTTDAYEAVAQAAVCINYLSTLGSEAIGMGKRVLTLNVYQQEVVVPSADGCGVVLSWEYEEFERKLLQLLEPNTPDIDAYFSQLKNDVMPINPRVFAAVANVCRTSQGAS